MPKGSHIFKARDGFSESAADFSLRFSDFETKSRIPDKANPTTGIFVLPVDSQTAYGTDGKIIDTFILYAAVGTNEATTKKLEGIGFLKHSGMNEAGNVAKIHNNDEYIRARKIAGIAMMKREQLDLGSLLVRVAPKNESAFTH